MFDLSNASVLVTGGTGSFGKKFTERILKEFPNIKRLVIYSRDELKQFEMGQVFSDTKYPAVRYFIGDIRDGARLKRALEGIDVVAAATERPYRRRIAVDADEESVDAGQRRW
jgi:FlaA1/EpsC-like NDP-sugar epimerase